MNFAINKISFTRSIVLLFAVVAFILLSLSMIFSNQVQINNNKNTISSLSNLYHCQKYVSNKDDTVYFCYSIKIAVDGMSFYYKRTYLDTVKTYQQALEFIKGEDERFLSRRPVMWRPVNN